MSMAAKLVESRKKSIAKLEAELREMASRPGGTLHVAFRQVMKARQLRLARLQEELGQFEEMVREESVNAEKRQPSLPNTKGK